MERVTADVLAECDRQTAKWGPQYHLDPVWLTILTEEVGEAAEATLDLTNPVTEGDAGARDELTREGSPERAALRAELVQVAAVAFSWLAALDQRGGD